MNGARGRSNNFLLDGTENNDISVAGQAFQVKIPDAVQEVSIQTANYDAEFGRAGGAVVNTIIKSGTNDFHGSLGYVLDATNDDAITNTQSLDPEIQKRGKMFPGPTSISPARLGGRIVTRQDVLLHVMAGAAAAFDEPGSSDHAFRGGEVEAAVSLSGRSQSSCRLISESHGRRHGYRSIRKYRAWSRSCHRQGPRKHRGGNGSVRLSAQVRRSPDNIQGRSPLQREGYSDGALWYEKNALPLSTANFPGYQSSEFNRYQAVVLSETHVFSPSFTNELRLPYNRFVLDVPTGRNGCRRASLPIYAFAPLNADRRFRGDTAGQDREQLRVQDTVSYVRGRHTFRTGVDLMSQRSRQVAPQVVRGSLLFGQLPVTRPSPTSWMTSAGQAERRVEISDRRFTIRRISARLTSSRIVGR